MLSVGIIRQIHSIKSNRFIIHIREGIRIRAIHDVDGTPPTRKWKLWKLIDIKMVEGFSVGVQSSRKYFPVGHHGYLLITNTLRFTCRWVRTGHTGHTGHTDRRLRHRCLIHADRILCRIPTGHIQNVLHEVSHRCDVLRFIQMFRNFRFLFVFSGRFFRFIRFFGHSKCNSLKLSPTVAHINNSRLICSSAVSTCSCFSFCSSICVFVFRCFFFHFLFFFISYSNTHCGSHATNCDYILARMRPYIFEGTWYL